VTTLDPSHGMPPDVDELDNEIHEDQDNEMEEPAESFHPTHSVTIKPAFPHTDVNTLSTQFKATNFIPALSTYIRRLIPPPALPSV
jgi:hypothetical protein